MGYYLFEGLGGSGKTTLINLVEKYFKSVQKEVVRTIEPGSGVKEIRDLLLYGHENIQAVPESQLFLFMADRSINLKKIVEPNLNEGKIILQDRGFISSLVYQGMEQGYGDDKIFELHKMSGLFDIFPDKVFIIDTSAEICLERLNRRDKENKHNYNKVQLDKLIKRRELYLEAANKFIPKEKLIIVKNDGSIEKSWEHIRDGLIKEG